MLAKVLFNRNVNMTVWNMFILYKTECTRHPGNTLGLTNIHEPWGYERVGKGHSIVNDKWYSKISPM